MIKVDVINGVVFMMFCGGAFNLTLVFCCWLLNVGCFGLFVSLSGGFLLRFALDRYLVFGFVKCLVWFGWLVLIVAFG